jgi:phosphocarrier protein FPr
MAALGLAGEMLHGRPVNIEIAAGLDEHTFGTDAVRVKEAIEKVDGPAGVVVLMDLGSAVLSAELAVDLLDDPTARDRVVLSSAPIVEGLIVAAVATYGGASVPRSRRRRGRADGQAALSGPTTSRPTSSPPPGRGSWTLHGRQPAWPLPRPAARP